jgi:hypothetical protein
MGGKNPVLGCGYGLGPETFRRRYCRRMPASEAIPFAENVVKIHYRRNWAPSVPRLWRDLERTARAAMLAPGTSAVAACGITYRLTSRAGLPCLVCAPLNGTLLHYIDARISPERVDYLGHPIWTYWAYRKGQWREIEPYGGQLTEHVVSGLARELLVDALFRFEDAVTRL